MQKTGNLNKTLKDAHMQSSSQVLLLPDSVVFCSSHCACAWEAWGRPCCFSNSSSILHCRLNQNKAQENPPPGRQITEVRKQADSQDFIILRKSSGTPVSDWYKRICGENTVVCFFNACLGRIRRPGDLHLFYHSEARGVYDVALPNVRNRFKARTSLVHRMI